MMTRRRRWRHRHHAAAVTGDAHARHVMSTSGVAILLCVVARVAILMRVVARVAILLLLLLLLLLLRDDVTERYVDVDGGRGLQRYADHPLHGHTLQQSRDHTVSSQVT